MTRKMSDIHSRLEKIERKQKENDKRYEELQELPVKNGQLQEQIMQNYEILQKEQTELINLVTQNHLTSQEKQAKLNDKVDKNHVEIMNILQDLVNS
jgi:hypothetical protein